MPSRCMNPRTVMADCPVSSSMWFSAAPQCQNRSLTSGALSGIGSGNRAQIGPPGGTGGTSYACRPAQVRRPCHHPARPVGPARRAGRRGPGQCGQLLRRPPSAGYRGRVSPVPIASPRSGDRHAGVPRRDDRQAARRESRAVGGGIGRRRGAPHRRRGRAGYRLIPARNTQLLGCGPGRFSPIKFTARPAPPGRGGHEACQPG